MLHGSETWSVRKENEVALQQAEMIRQCLGEEMYEYEVEGARPRGRPKKTWREIVENDCQARKWTREDAVDRSCWRKLMRDD